MSRVKVIVLLALALVVCQVQCVAACAAAACAPSDSTNSPNLPPCHHHHSNHPGPSPCSHRTTVSMAISQTGPQPWVMTVSALPVEAALDAPQQMFATVSAPIATHSRLFSLSSIVLRV